MLPRHSAVSGVIAISLVALPLTACATSPSAAPSGPAGQPVWSSLAGEELAASLAADELRLDALLAAGAGVDPADLPRLASLSADTATTIEGAAAGAAPLVVNTALVSTPTKGEATGAAANALSFLYEQVRDSLGTAAEAERPESSSVSEPGANPGFIADVKDGTASGQSQLTVADTDAQGDTYELAMWTTYRIGVCPSAAGATDGTFTVEGIVTFTPKGGAPRRSTVDIRVELSTQTSEAALVESVTVDVEGTSAYGPASETDTTGIDEPDGDEKVWGQLDLAFGDEGAGAPGDIGVDTEASDADFGSVVDDLAGQVTRLLVKAQEDYLRDGNCVELRITPEQVNVQKGESTGITVEPVSLVDGAAVTTGTVRSEGVDGPGVVTPAGDQKVGTPFVYEAGDTGGPAEQAFSATSRRGIARGATYISVTEGWSFDDTYEGVRVTGTKCDGLSGAWVMTAEGVGWDYTAGIVAEFDEELRGSYTLAGSADGFDFEGGGEMWMEPVPGGYDIHASTGPNVFHVRAAPDGACS